MIACGLFGRTLVVTQRCDLASKDVVFSACEVVLLVLLVDLCAQLLVRTLGACGMSDPPSVRCGDGHAREQKQDADANVHGGTPLHRIWIIAVGRQP